ncbi:hypothetical protein [Sphingobium sp.]|uniref:hypothetical protein n=1 Tax=Sphingobium sp. TaxID=1912891 RepID=UPI003BB78EF6
MTATIQPPWGTDWKPAPPPVASEPRGPGNPSWVKNGPSPNPNGRPAGIPDRRLLATQQMLDEMRNIVAVLIGKALEGDSNSAAILMAKCLPSIKAQAEKVSFDFDASAPISDQVAQVLDAVAAGTVAPDVGRLIIDSIARLADVRASEELAARIEALEEANGARG